MTASLAGRRCGASLLTHCGQRRYNAKRRRVSAPALVVNPRVGGFRYGLLTSGGRTRTCDLRVMSPTSCQLLYPAVSQDSGMIVVVNTARQPLAAVGPAGCERRGGAAG